MSEHEQPDEQLREILDPDVELPGRQLREARESAQMSCEEVAHHLHLDVQIVKALESDNYDKLPSPIYICGYLRSYARLLKLPDVEIVNAYSKGQEINASLIPENVKILPDKQVVNPAAVKATGLVILAILALIGIALISEKFGVFDYFQNTDQQALYSTVEPEITNEPPFLLNDQIFEQIESEQSTIVARPLDEDSQPTAEEIDKKISEFENKISQENEVPVAKQQVAITAGQLKFVFRENSWIEVKDKDKNQLAYRLANAGSEMQVDGAAPFYILLGNAQGVDVYYKGELFNHERFHRNKIAYFRLGVAE